MSDIGELLPNVPIVDFCKQWKIDELALFGSVLRDDFGPESDIDMLVTFSDDAAWGVLEHIQMQQELQKLLGRDVDLISRRAIEQSDNWIRRKEILNTAQVYFSKNEVVHAAG